MRYLFWILKPKYLINNIFNQIFIDKISGTKTQRPGLDQCLAELKTGDTLIVWRLDRLGRSMRHLVLLIQDLRQKGIGFKYFEVSSFFVSFV